MPDDVLETGTSETGNDIDLLSEGAEETLETPETSETDAETSIPEEEAEEEIKEEPSEEEEETGEEEEILEESTRPAWKTIKEKYPELAKDKDFKNVFFREKAFSEVFPTVQDAKDAAEKTQIFDFLDSSLSQGDPKELISSLNENAVAKFAQNILPSLHSANPQLFRMATQPIIFELLNEINDTGLRNKDENLQISVKNVAKFLTGKFEVPPRNARNNPELEQERRSLQEERDRMISSQRDSFFSRADSSIKRQLVKTIEDGIDPKGELSDFTKQALVDKILTEVRSTVADDQAFASKMKHLSRLAEKAGYPPDYMPRFISAYLGRAKQLALSLRAKHKATAIGKSTRSPNKTVRVEGKNSPNTNQTNNSKGGKVDYRKMSDLDILNS